MRKKAVEDGEYFWQEENGCEDTCFLLRYGLKNKNKIKCHSLSPLSIYSKHSEQLSGRGNKAPRVFIRRFECITKYTPEPMLDSPLGYFYCLSGDLKRGREYLLKSLRKKFSFFNVFFFCLSFFGVSFYRRTDFFLRMVHRWIIGRIRRLKVLLYYRFKYPESFREAERILRKWI